MVADSSLESWSGGVLNIMKVVSHQSGAVLRIYFGSQSAERQIKETSIKIKKSERSL